MFPADILAHPHICGIGGIGMSGVALLLRDLNIPVSGSDLRKSEITSILESRGVTFHDKPNTDALKSASCVIASRTFPNHHPEILEAKRLNLPILSRTAALGLIQKQFLSRCCLCFGTTTRAKLSRLAASCADFGWCSGVLRQDITNDSHATLKSQMCFDIDERDFWSNPQDFQYLKGDILISDWQSPHLGYYSDDFNPNEFVDRAIHQLLPKDGILVAPSSHQSPNRLKFDIFCHNHPLHTFEFALDPIHNTLSFPTEWQEPPVTYQGTYVDASALAAAKCWLKCHQIQTTPTDFPCIGWFNPISSRHFHEIRMHPINIQCAIHQLRIKAQNRPIHIAIKPFASTLFSYSPDIWQHIFKNTEQILIICPPYEGCTTQDCDLLCHQLQSVSPNVQCVSLQQARDMANSLDDWLWIGAPDIL